MIIYIIRIVDNQNFFNRALTQQVNIQYIQIYNTGFMSPFQELDDICKFKINIRFCKYFSNVI